MIKTLTIALIISGLIIFFLILALIGQLNDLCEYEKKINKAIEYIEDNTYKSNETEYMDLTGIRELLDILKGEDKE